MKPKLPITGMDDSRSLNSLLSEISQIAKSQMTNQEIITAVEEWVEEHEYYVEETFDTGTNDINEVDSYMVEGQSLITFLKRLLHE